MSILDDHNKIQRWAQNHEVAPDTQLWSRVEDRLKHEKENKKTFKIKRLYSIASIAASLLLIIGFFTLIYVESHQVQLVQKGKVEQWEVLETSSDYFYKLEDVRRSHEYYDAFSQPKDQSILEGASGFPVILGDNFGKSEW